MELASLLVSEGGRNVMAEAFDFRTLRGGETFDVGPFHIEAFEMTHIGVQALGYRIEAGGRILAYTGDTGPCDAAVEIARDADLYLAEATYQDASNLMPFHLSATQAGEAAKAAGAKRLMLTHITPDLDPEVSRAEAAAAFDGTGRHRGAGPDGRGGRVTRPDGRAADELRPVTWELGFQEWAAGSVLFSMGRTRVLVRGQRQRGRAPLAEGHRQGLGDRRVLDASRRHERAVPP